MPDWKKFVEDRIATRSLTREQREEIIREIAAHFEDVFETARYEGLAEDEAFERAANLEVDWQRLAAQIQRTKQREERMKDRTKRLWVRGSAGSRSSPRLARFWRSCRGLESHVSCG